MKTLKLLALALTLACMSLAAQAFTLTVEYVGVVAEVDVGGNAFWGYEEGDPITGTFYIDLDNDGEIEFIDSTHAPSGPNVDLIHEYFAEADEFIADEDAGEAELGIFNVGGFINDDDDEGGGAALVEILEAWFDASYLNQVIETGGPVWIDGEDLDAYGLIFALFENDELGGEEYIGFDVTSLHLEIAALSEPGTLGLLSLGLLGMSLARRKKAA